MEFIFFTSSVSNIQRETIGRITSDKKINPEIAIDIKQIFKIRDVHAQRLNLSKAKVMEKGILSNMDCVKTKSTNVSNWNKKDLDIKIIDVSDWVFVSLLWSLIL